MSEEVIELDFNAQKHALDAYHCERYFEAMQLMHGHLESSVRTLLFLNGPKREATEFVHVQHISQEVSLSQGIKCLYVFGIVSKQQYDNAVQFNRARNKIVHEFHASKVMKENTSINRKLFESVFFGANDLSNELILKATES